MSEGGEPGPVQDQPAPVVGEHGDTGTESEMLPVLSVAPDDTKHDIRKKVWQYMEKHNLANFPRPVVNRIPNFKTAAQSCERSADLDVFKKARTIKVNPDKPQEEARFRVLEANKTLLVPTPRLRQGLFNKITPPENPNKETLRKCATSQGVREFSSPIGLDAEVKVDLVIVGSVAVSPQGLRIGKGEGYADLEFAMMSSMEAVNENTIIVSCVHDCQVLDMPEELFGSHDITVNYICTPTRLIDCPLRPKPSGIIWSMLTREKLRQIPILRKLRAKEKAMGKTVTLKNETEGDTDAEKENIQSGDSEGEGRNRDRVDRRRRRMRRNRPRYPRRREDSGRDGSAEPGEAPPQKPQKVTSEDGQRERSGDEGGNNARRPRYRRYRPRGRRPPAPRPDNAQEGSEGEADYDNKKESLDEDRQRRPLRPGRERGFRRRNWIRSGGSAPTVYVGSVPRSVRVSEFKTQVRGLEVNPLRVIWHGATGHAFLQFETRDEADEAVNLLQDLKINDKSLRVELSNRTRGKLANSTENPVDGAAESGEGN